MYVTLYTKQACQLCHVLKADLLLLQSEIGFVLYEVDIDRDGEAARRYQHLIPVVDIQGGPLLYAPISYDDLFDALDTDKRNSATEGALRSLHE
ncbi:MAG: glutaredoxin family protein [Chloroflexota bacterium]